MKVAHREVVASRHNNPKVTIMTFPTRFGLSAGPAAADPQDQSDKSQDQQTQQQKDDAARKQAQNDPNKQRTPQ